MNQPLSYFTLTTHKYSRINENVKSKLLFLFTSNINEIIYIIGKTNIMIKINIKPSPVTSKPTLRSLPITSPIPPAITDTTSASFMTNQVGWLTLTLTAIANTLELPSDKTMKELPAHAIKIMQELHTLRAKN